MKPTKLFDIKAMFDRLANPYWSPLHPSEYALNCEGRYGPGAEFDADPRVRIAWNIFWAMSYKISSPKEVGKLNIPLMRKEIAAAIAVSRIHIRLNGVDYTIGQLSLLMSHSEFSLTLQREVQQLKCERAQDALAGLDPATLVSVLRRRLITPVDSSLSK